MKKEEEEGDKMAADFPTAAKFNRIIQFSLHALDCGKVDFRKKNKRINQSIGRKIN